MRKIAIVIFCLQFCVLSLFAADAPKECSLCVGATADLSTPPAAVIPLVLQIRESDLATTPVDALSPEQRSKLTLTVSYTIDAKDAMNDVETHTKNIIEWARARGPFDALGVAAEGAETTIAAYAAKRLAVTAHGLNVAMPTVHPAMTTDCRQEP